MSAGAGRGDRRCDEFVEQARKDLLRGGGPECVAGVLHDHMAHEPADVAAAQRRLGVTEKIGEAVVAAAEDEQARGPSGSDSAEVAGEGGNWLSSSCRGEANAEMARQRRACQACERPVRGTSTQRFHPFGRVANGALIALDRPPVAQPLPVRVVEIEGRVDRDDAVDAKVVAGGLKRQPSAGTQSGDDDRTLRRLPAHEFDRFAGVVEHVLRIGDALQVAAGWQSAVAEAAEIEAQHEVAALGPPARHGDVEPVRSDVMTGAGIQEDDCWLVARLITAGQDPEQPLACAKAYRRARSPAATRRSPAASCAEDVPVPDLVSRRETTPRCHEAHQ